MIRSNSLVEPPEEIARAEEPLRRQRLRRQLERASMLAVTLPAVNDDTSTRMATVRLVLTSGIDDGVLPANLDVGLMVDLLQTALQRQDRGTPAEQRAVTAVGAVWPLICPAPPESSSSGETSLKAANIELRRSNDDLTAFAHVAAHDLSEPLRMVASFLDLLERRYGADLDERAHRYIWFARDGALRMRQMIDALLSFAEIGAAELHLTAVDTAQVAARVLADLQPLVSEAGAQVTLEDLPTVTADGGLLAQLLQNLVANAVKFRSPARAPLITIGACRDGGGWRFTVTDNGIGIPAANTEHVFEMFTRLNARTDYAGSGIGLSLCRKIVQRHGGTIKAQSSPSGEGTQIEFRLPDQALGNRLPEPGASATAP